MSVLVESRWIKEVLSFEPGNTIQISIVTYGHPMGIPARFCAGLVPAIDLVKQLESRGLGSIIRVMDPTPIANYCNGWQANQSQSHFREVVSDFLDRNGSQFFFDEAEQLSETAVEVLRTLGTELEASDGETADIVNRIKESGRKHGGEAGAMNAALYMAAHPFSWLDMHHPSIWKKSYPSEGYQFVNLMSKSEERFAVIRKFLKERRPDLCTTNNPIDSYMTICDTPCYVPLEEEPTFPELRSYGYDWCLRRYNELKKKSSNHGRAYKDFKALMSFLGLELVEA
jgi:hypothetical protein